MGPFPIVVRQLKFLVVGIDYFTKWVEVEALARIASWQRKDTYHLEMLDGRKLQHLWKMEHL